MFVDIMGYLYPQIYFPQIFNKVMNHLISNQLPTNFHPHKYLTKYWIILYQTSYPPNYVPANQKNFGNLWILAPTNKNDFTVHQQASYRLRWHYCPISRLYTDWSDIIVQSTGIIQTEETLLSNQKAIQNLFIICWLRQFSYTVQIIRGFNRQTSN